MAVRGDGEAAQVNTCPDSGCGAWRGIIPRAVWVHDGAGEGPWPLYLGGRRGHVEHDWRRGSGPVLGLWDYGG